MCTHTLGCLGAGLCVRALILRVFVCACARTACLSGRDSYCVCLCVRDSYCVCLCVRDSYCVCLCVLALILRVFVCA